MLNTVGDSVVGIYRVDEITIDVVNNCVRCHDGEHVLRYQTFQVLLYLIKHYERLVSKDELLSRIWHDTAVTDNALAQCVAEIRKTLGDDPRRPKYIKTFPKNGYQFMRPVDAVHEEQLPSQIPTTAVMRISDIASDAVPENKTSYETAHTPPLARRTLSFSNVRNFLLLFAGILALAIGWRLQWLPNTVVAESTHAISSNSPNLAVMNFENESHRPDVDWLCQGLADMMITDLSRSGSLQVLSRQQLASWVHSDLGQPGKSAQFDQVMHMAQTTHTANVLLGGFSLIEGQYRIDVQVYDTYTGQIIFADHVIFAKQSDLLSEVDVLAEQLTSKLELDSTKRPTSLK